jgi:hypothetical protein
MVGKLHCVKCRLELEPAAVGHPPRYRSTECRRAAEYEIRRLQRRLEKLEDELQRVRSIRSDWMDHLGHTRAEQTADLEAAIADQETRLRALLRADGGLP